MERGTDAVEGAVLPRRRFFELFGTIGAMAGATVLLGGCAGGGGDADADAEGDGEGATSAVAETVVDANGRDVVIPETVERVAITCQGGATQEVVVFGGADKIVAQPPMTQFDQLIAMYPQMADVTNAGSFDDLNIETLVACEPDIALVSVTSSKGNAQIEEVGIPTYVMWVGQATVDALLQEFLNVSRILGNPEKGERLVAYWEDVLDRVGSIADAVPESERKTVYCLQTASITDANTGDWRRSWIDTVGADFAVPESDLNGEVTIEKVMTWDPDVIVVTGGYDLAGLYDDGAIQELSAIRNRQVHAAPIGAFWWERPSPESILGFLWLAQVVYPDYATDIDLARETKDFFREFYDYELSDEEYQSFFA